MSISLHYVHTDLLNNLRIMEQLSSVFGGQRFHSLEILLKASLQPSVILPIRVSTFVSRSHCSFYCHAHSSTSSRWCHTAFLIYVSVMHIQCFLYCHSHSSWSTTRISMVFGTSSLLENCWKFWKWPSNIMRMAVSFLIRAYIYACLCPKLGSHLLREMVLLSYCYSDNNWGSDFSNGFQ